jgi:hypothetical protein
MRSVKKVKSFFNKYKLFIILSSIVVISIAIAIPVAANRGWFPKIFDKGIAVWQYPLITGVSAKNFISGPLPDGSGDQDAIIQVDPKFTPFAVPFLFKQLPVTVAGTVYGMMHKHSYPELIGFMSNNFTSNSADEMKLCGTITVYIGKNMEQHSFDAPTLIYIPANVPHGVVVYGDDISKPISFIDTFPDGKKGSEIPLPHLMNELPDFINGGLPDKSENPPYTSDQDKMWNPAGGGVYGKYFFSGSKPNSAIQLPTTQLKLIPGEIPGVDMTKSPLFIYTSEDSGMFNNFPLHVPHAHPCDEYLGFFSCDPNDPHNLGMTLRLYIYDYDSQKMVARDFTKPFIGIMQKSKTLHTPMIHKNMTRKTGFIWYAINYDPSVFRDVTLSDGTFIPAVKFAASGQRHNLYYTHNRYDATNGIPPEDQPIDVNGTDAMMISIEPHTAWSCSKCHGVTVPPLE